MEHIEELETGTTTVGLTIGSGVVLAADKRATMGHLKASKEAQKVFQIDDTLGITIAGSVGDAQRLIRFMQSELKKRKLETRELSVRGSATLLANVLQGSKMMPYMNQFIMGGLDNDGKAVFDLDPLGGRMEQKKFTSTGSGSPTAYGVLEDSYEEDMNIEEGVKIAIRAVEAASERDTASGDGIDVAKITGSGFNRLSPEEVEDYMD
ncbi:MAG: archaeal proteasome endopeptidase complex subunit beta [Candidatus Nanohaloarchaeota archaeon QJJ-7]|nr:archaeal proteasome endopeptidase complex subunit beta [Candidatus Nanohaloarchaeota archaeon QJJ-7]